jgi:hypothetical protein
MEVEDLEIITQTAHLQFSKKQIYKIPNNDRTRFLTLVVPAEAESSTLSKEKSESEIGSQAFPDAVISTSVPLHWNSLMWMLLNSGRSSFLLDKTLAELCHEAWELLLTSLGVLTDVLAMSLRVSVAREFAAAQSIGITGLASLTKNESAECFP